MYINETVQRNFSFSKRQIKTERERKTNHRWICLISSCQMFCVLLIYRQKWIWPDVLSLVLSGFASFLGRLPLSSSQISQCSQNSIRNKQKEMERKRSAIFAAWRAAGGAQRLPEWQRDPVTPFLLFSSCYLLQTGRRIFFWRHVATKNKRRKRRINAERER